MLDNILKFAFSAISYVGIKLKKAMKKHYVFRPDGNLIHLLNDPTTPELVEQISYNSATERAQVVPLKFKVEGYAGGGYPLDSEPGRAANCYLTALKTLEWFNNHKFKNVNWACVASLPIHPEAGQDLNAFYDRRSVKMFGIKNWYAANSSDILAHELGHGLLDACRPDTWNIQSIELWSFHEAFGDLCAMLTALQNDLVINKMLKETDGTLKSSNVVSKVAEEFGKAIYQLAGPQGGRNPDYLRNLVNDYKYVNPETLPQDGTYETISAECHSFSRIFAGAFYDIFVMMYNHNLKKTAGDKIMAVKMARNVLAKYVLKAVSFVPLNPRFYEAFARTILWVDFSDKKEFHDRMWEIFVERNIISPVKSFSAFNKKEVKDGIVVAQSSAGAIVKTGNVETTKLSNISTFKSLSFNPLYDVDVDVAAENFYIFDKNDNAIEYIEITEEDKITSAKYCLDRLFATGGVSDKSDTPFEIKNNKLVRTYFDCYCCKEI